MLNQNIVHNSYSDTAPVAVSSDTIISELADTQDEQFGKLNTWTRYKTVVGLRRFADDICDNQIGDLPLRETDYEEKLTNFLAEFPSFTGLYPSYAIIKKHFVCLPDAWLETGFEVEQTTPRARRHKYIITQEIEDRLKEIYTDPDRAKRKCKELPGMKAYAQSVGIPKYYLIRHASKLGLGFVKEPQWTEEEFRLLEELGHYVPYIIQKKFAEKGFTRTQTSIRMMRKRRRVHKQSGFYSLNSISKLLGIDSHVVAGWAAENLLTTVLKGTKRGESNDQSSGDTRLIHESELYRFITRNPTKIDLRKVDQSWFLYIITKGEIPFAGSDRLSKRMEIGIELKGNSDKLHSVAGKVKRKDKTK